MAPAIPAIIALVGTVATIALTKDKIQPITGPDPADAEKKAAEQQENIAAGRERFLQRQGSLGPIQLQAPTLKI